MTPKQRRQHADEWRELRKHNPQRARAMWRELKDWLRNMGSDERTAFIEAGL